MIPPDTEFCDPVPDESSKYEDCCYAESGWWSAVLSGLGIMRNNEEGQYKTTPEGQNRKENMTFKWFAGLLNRSESLIHRMTAFWASKGSTGDLIAAFFTWI